MQIVNHELSSVIVSAVLFLSLLAGAFAAGYLLGILIEMKRENQRHG